MWRMQNKLQLTRTQTITAIFWDDILGNGRVLFSRAKEPQNTEVMA